MQDSEANEGAMAAPWSGGVNVGAPSLVLI